MPIKENINTVNINCWKIVGLS